MIGILTKFLLEHYKYKEGQWLTVIQVLQTDDYADCYSYKLANGVEISFSKNHYKITKNQLIFPYKKTPMILTTTEVSYQDIRESFQLVICKNPNPKLGDIIYVGNNKHEDKYIKGRFLAYDKGKTYPWVVEVQTEEGDTYVDRFMWQKERGEIERDHNVFTVRFDYD